MPKYASMLLFYSTIMLIVSLADGIMSYVSPYFIETYVQNTFTMGIIIATSSVVGILCDALIPSFFRAKHFMFFL